MAKKKQGQKDKRTNHNLQNTTFVLTYHMYVLLSQTHDLV